MKKCYYIYRHIRLDTNTPFYVGKGKDKRAFERDGRNIHWIRVVNKHNYRVEIMLDELTEEQAFEKEREFIKLYKSLGYCGANLTDGGEGSSGRIISQQTRQKMSKPKTEKHKRALSQSRIGKPGTWIGKKHSLKTRQLMSESRKGISKPYVNSDKQTKCINKLNQFYKDNGRSFEVREKIARTLGSKPFVVLDKITNELIGEFLIKADFVRKFGGDVGGIISCLKRELKTHNGFIFKYKEKIC